MSSITQNWLRHYAHLHKMSSYHDKLQAVYEQRNPYYLLEWLFFPPSSELLTAIDFNRSPGMVRNSYIPFADVMFNQIIIGLAFAAYDNRRSHELKLQTAVYDLQQHHGIQLWKQAVQAWEQQLQTVWQKWDECQTDIQALEAKLEKQYREKVKQLKEEVAEHSEPLADLLLEAKAVYEQRKKEGIDEIIHQRYKPWPLIAYIHVNQIEEAAQQLRWLGGQCLIDTEPVMVSMLRQKQYDVLLQNISADQQLYKRFIQWIPAYASKTLMTAEHVNTDERQHIWLAWLTYLLEAQKQDDTHLDIWDVTYDIDGISESMMSQHDVPPYLHQLVTLAIQRDHHRIKWLREAIVLRYWTICFQAFNREEYEFEQLSWILCLDPDSIEARFIRSYKQAQQNDHRHMAFMKERLSQIFIDTLRRGIRVEMMIPLLQHLTVHHIDFIYTYIHNMKDTQDFVPLLQMEDAWLQRIFAGKGQRAAIARRAVMPLFFAWFEQHAHDADQRLLNRWGKIFYDDKGECLQQWLASLEQTGSGWQEADAKVMAACLDIEWLAPLSDEQATHEQVVDWLANHSDWVRFERDGVPDLAEGMLYTIVKPGYIDRRTGQLLARVVIRAQLKDPQMIANVLDELKDL